MFLIALKKLRKVIFKLIIAIASLYAIISTPVLAEQTLPPRPTSLDGFVNAKNFTNLQAAITNSSHIYLPVGTYVVNNPVILDRSTPLFLFGVGSGNQASRIIPTDPTKPVFVVKKIPRLSLYGLTVDQGSPSLGGVSGVKAFEFSNTEHVQFEMQDSSIQRSYIDINGPVTTVMQLVNISDQGDMNPGNASGLVINHPQAEAYLVGFGGVHHDYHVHQKQGHLESHGLSNSFHRVADFLIESPSPKGTHIIAGGRSEGSNKSGIPSLLLKVPATSEAVDIVVKAMDLNGTKDAQAPMIDYNAKGSLWLMSSTGGFGVNALVDGVAADATIVAIGNTIRGGPHPSQLLPIAGKSGSSIRLFNNCNIYDYQRASGLDDAPFRRFADTCDADIGAVPPLPSINKNAVHKLDRPVINSQPVDLLHSVAEFGADPTDTASDTVAIQQAIDEAGPYLYFPAGTYYIDAPLVFSDRSGGLMAGAGSSNTHIISSADSVFVTDGMARVAWQGMTLEVKNKRALSGSVMAITWPQHTGETIPSGTSATANSFHDMVFDGARYGISMGNEQSPHSCSETMITDSVIRNAYLGVATGSWNAHNQWLHGVSFDSNKYNVGVRDGLSGGSWFIFSGNATNTQYADTHKVNGGHNNIYYNNFFTDSPAIFTSSGSSAIKHVFFENSLFQPATPQIPYLKWRTSGGVMFLNTTLVNNTPGSIMQQYDLYKWSDKFAISLHSEIQDWGEISLDIRAKKYSLAHDKDGDGFVSTHECNDQDASSYPGAP